MLCRSQWVARHQFGSAFADDKADVVAAVNWFLDNLGSDTLGKALIPASEVAWADGVGWKR